MLHRLPILFAVLWISSFASLAQADLVVFGSDSGKSTELADLVNKNADVRNAISAFERGDIAECERLFSQALKSDKNLPSVDIMIARLSMQKGQLSEATARLEGYLNKGVQDAEAHATLGEIALMSGRNSDAWLQFREAMTVVKTSNLSKSRKEAFVNQLLQRRAETALRRQDLTTAQTLYKELEAAMPESGFPLMAQARIFILNGDITRGADLLRRAKKLDPTVPQPELQIAMALAGGKDATETEKWFRDGLKQTETVTIANWFEYLKWLLAQDRPQDVQYLVQRAPANFQSDRLLRFLNAMAFRYLGKPDEAEKAFSKLLSENTGDMESADQLALILADSLDQGKKSRAKQLAESNLRRAPNEENAIATAAWVEYSLSGTDIADQYLNSLIARGTSNPQTIYYVARILEARGQTEEAMNIYKSVVDMPGLFVQRTEVKEKLAAKAKEGTDKGAKSIPAKPKFDGEVTAPVPLTPPSGKKSDSTPPNEKAKK